MSADRVVGYAYDADLYCAACMRDLALDELAALGDTTDRRRASAEEVVTAWAHALGLTYPAPHGDAHDSGDFPAPVFGSDDQAEDRCPQRGCGQRLWDS